MMQGPVGHVQYSSDMVDDFIADRIGRNPFVIDALELGLITSTLAMEPMLCSIAVFW